MSLEPEDKCPGCELAYDICECCSHDYGNCPNCGDCLNCECGGCEPILVEEPHEPLLTRTV